MHSLNGSKRRKRRTLSPLTTAMMMFLPFAILLVADDIMATDGLIEAIIKLGFAAVVAFYLLVKTTRSIDGLAKEVSELRVSREASIEAIAREVHEIRQWIDEMSRRMAR
jgi:hypothetical protein